MYDIAPDMNIIITGATGMVGSEVVRQAIEDPAIEKIVLLIRNASAFSHLKVRQVIHSDFTSYTGLDDIFKETDACLWCLGISQSRVSKSEYYTTTHDYAVAAAKAMLAANPDMAFVFLSGQGADSSERSFVRFAKVKGQAENSLARLNPKKLFIFRPGGITATNRNKKESAYKKFEILMVKIMAAVFPWSVISTKDLAIAMLKVAGKGFNKIILSHWDIKNL
jgi:uncharacterized protein YbjT (DUF2867 family)